MLRCYKIERLIRKSLPVLSLPELPPDRPKPPRSEQRRFYRDRHFSGRGRQGQQPNRQKKRRPSQNKRRRGSR